MGGDRKADAVPSKHVGEVQTETFQGNISEKMSDRSNIISWIKALNMIAINNTIKHTFM